MTDLTVTLIQTSLYWEDIEANLKMLEEKILQIRERTMIVVLPEMFSTGFSMQPEKIAQPMNGSAVQWMRQTARQHNIILCGSLAIEENGHYFNRLIWMLPDGTYGQYDKRHLFAYGGEHECYTPGNKRLIASVKGWKLCLNVCYDLRFPVWSRQTSPPEYDVLVYVANWPPQRSTAWNTLLQARAIENQCYVVGVNRVGRDGNGLAHDGDSAVIDPLGEMIYRKNKEEAIFTCTLSRQRLETVRKDYPFLDDADKFIML